MSLNNVKHCMSSSDTQGWFRSLHQPLGRLVEIRSMYCWMNTIILLVSSLFSNEQDDQWKQTLQESGYLIGPHALYRFSVAVAFLANCPRGWCSERNHPWVSKDDCVMLLVQTSPAPGFWTYVSLSQKYM